MSPEYDASDVTALGAAVRSLRTEAGLTQAELAERAGVSRAWLNRLEGGRHDRAELVRVLGVLRHLGTVVRLEKPEPHEDRVEQEAALSRILGETS